MRQRYRAEAHGSCHRYDDFNPLDRDRRIAGDPVEHNYSTFIPIAEAMLQQPSGSALPDCCTFLSIIFSGQLLDKFANQKKALHASVQEKCLQAPLHKLQRG